MVRNSITGRLLSISRLLTMAVRRDDRDSTQRLSFRLLYGLLTSNRTLAMLRNAYLNREVLNSSSLWLLPTNREAAFT